ncbi:MAG: hypothetical protein NT092_08980 [Bacteroidia bacterium]|nr:hypothetical protein [Bacteroidia bacterium]
MRIAYFLIFCLSFIFNESEAQWPVRIGVAGLSHSHVLPLLRNLDRQDIQTADLASPEINLTVVEILEAASKSRKQVNKLN